MRTDELIHLLARGAGPAPRALPARRIGLALGGGALIALIAALASIGPIPAALFALPGPWIKLGYALSLSAASAIWVVRLGQPGAPARRPPRFVLLVLATMVLLGLFSLAATPAGERAQALLGKSWALCPLIVLALALPTLAGGLWALRGMAPTRPRRAGLAAGVLAGAVGAFAYAFACDELAPSFVAVWYSAGIALSGTVGAWLGPRWLQW